MAHPLSQAATMIDRWWVVRTIFKIQNISNVCKLYILSLPERISIHHLTCYPPHKPFINYDQLIYTTRCFKKKLIRFWDFNFSILYYQIFYLLRLLVHLTRVLHVKLFYPGGVFVIIKKKLGELFFNNFYEYPIFVNTLMAIKL